MRMRVLTTKLRVEIENEMRIILESLSFEIEMRVSQKSVKGDKGSRGPNLAKGVIERQCKFFL